MKLNNIAYSALAGAAFLGLQACSPDEYSMDSIKYPSESLTQGGAYTVTADANDPNLIHCQTSLTGVQGIWETPNGRFVGQSCDLSFPFSGDYWVVFGVMENGGISFGDTCRFTVSTNNFSSLTDQLWTNLTGGIGKSKKWVPVNKDYGVGQCTAPVMYMSPDDVQNNGKGVKDLKLNNGGKDNWSPNWDPGFQSWLIPADSKYMDSYMTFSLSEANGCTIEEFQGEKGVTTKGKFNFNISDKTAPTISFIDAFSMHNQGFDDVCGNYSTDIKIIELTPYMLQIATMRTNDEGPWWIVWNFIAADVHDGLVEIPNDNVLESAPVVAPEVGDLETALFTIVGDNGIYDANSVTFILNEDKAYDYYWWDGSNGAWTERGVYGTDLYPKYSDDEFALTLTKKDGKILFEEEKVGIKGEVVIAGNKLSFVSEADAAGVQNPIDIAFFTNDKGAKVCMNSSEILVVKADANNNKFFFALEDTKDATGVVNQYLVANMEQKSIFGAAGPVALPVDNEKLEVYIEAGKYLRCQLYNPWGGKNECMDISKLKVKDGQSVSISFKVSGVEWSKDPIVALCDNAIVDQWEPDTFNGVSAVKLNKDGETTIKITNNTGEKVTYDGSSAFILCVQFDGYGSIPTATADNAAEGVKFEITSLVIE